MLKVLLRFLYTLLAIDAGLIAVFLANRAKTPLTTTPIIDLGPYLVAAGDLGSVYSVPRQLASCAF